MLISILMPVYNAENFLEECLESISCQTFKQWELLAVDDGSSDQSHFLLQKWARKDTRIKVFTQEKSGIIPALRLAYKHSNADLITRMDADDKMPIDKLEALYSAWKKEPEQLAIGKVSYFSETALGEGYKRYAEWLNQNLDKKDPYAEIYRECIIASCAWLVDRKVFEACGGLNANRYPEDYDLSFRMYKNNLKLNVIPNIVHHWRDHPERSSRNDPNYLDNRFLELKLAYFINLEIDDKDLILLGAGKKGKWIAQQLIKEHIDFDWETNNEKKVDVNIYDKFLKKEEPDSWVGKKIIVAVANQDDLLALTDLFKSKKLTSGKDYFFFA